MLSTRLWEAMQYKYTQCLQNRNHVKTEKNPNWAHVHPILGWEAEPQGWAPCSSSHRAAPSGAQELAAEGAEPPVLPAAAVHTGGKASATPPFGEKNIGTIKLAQKQLQMTKQLLPI